MKIKVTEKDIANGKRFQGSACPIALAVHRASCKRAFVGKFEIQATPTSSVKCELPAKAQKFVFRFDERKGTLKPFSFVIPDRKWKELKVSSSK